VGAAPGPARGRRGEPARLFVTTEDALRAVLRGFGVRAKLIADHLDLMQGGEVCWQLMGIDPADLGQSRWI
jgi:hypothetical protein